MLTWKTSEDQDVHVEYSVTSLEFSDYRLFDRFQMRERVDPREECLINNNPFYVQFCDVIYPKGRVLQHLDCNMSGYNK